jgi:hypothetical protein
MRTLTKALLVLNLLLLAFIGLWLLVGGSNRGYFGGGAASEVDGILLLFLSLFNVAFLVTVLLTLSSSSPVVAKAAAEVAGDNVFRDDAGLRKVMRSWSLWALTVNGALILFVGLWLLVSADRRGYFQANATEVDMILLLFLCALNLAYMGLMFLRFSRPLRRA